MRPISKWFLGGTIGCALIAVLWGVVAAPALVKFPTNIDMHARYTGTMNVYVDQATGLPLAQPQHIPMTIQRDMIGVPKQSSSSQAVVDETVTMKAGPLTQVQQNRYVLDRKSNMNVASPLAYAFAPANPVDRSGTYSFQFDRGMKSSGQYPMFNDYTAATYQLRQTPAGPATVKLDGLSVNRMTGTATPTAVSPFFAGVLAAQGLPTQLTAAQVNASLKAKGIDLSQSLTALAGTLQPAELQQLQQLFSAPVKLHYVWSTTGDVAVEPKTGSVVNMNGAVQALGVASDPAALIAAGGILAKYDSIPAVHAALGSMKALAAAPAQPVYDLSFNQTPASTADLVSKTKSNVTKMTWVQTYIPVGFAILAIGCLIVTVVTFRPRHTDEEVKEAELPWTEATPKAA